MSAKGTPLVVLVADSVWALERCVARTLAGRNRVVLPIPFAVGAICVVRKVELAAIIMG